MIISFIASVNIMLGFLLLMKFDPVMIVIMDNYYEYYLIDAKKKFATVSYHEKTVILVLFFRS